MKKFFNSYSRLTGSKALFFVHFFVYTSLLVLLFVAAHAQSGERGLNAATVEVQKYFDHGTKLMYAIGAIVGIVGAIKVYNKWNSGDNDTGKVASSWLGSCIFLIVVSAILRGFFL